MRCLNHPASPEDVRIGSGRQHRPHPSGRAMIRASAHRRGGFTSRQPGRRRYHPGFSLRKSLPWLIIWMTLTLIVEVVQVLRLTGLLHDNRNGFIWLIEGLNRFMPDLQLRFVTLQALYESILPVAAIALSLWVTKTLWEAWRVKY
jgi:hypothetical protein